LGKM